LGLEDIKMLPLKVTLSAPVPGAARKANPVMKIGGVAELNCPTPNAFWNSKEVGVEVRGPELSPPATPAFPLGTTMKGLIPNAGALKAAARAMHSKERFKMTSWNGKISLNL
jgi:hypothetical protein